MKTVGDDRTWKRNLLRTIALAVLAFGLSAAAAATVRALWKLSADPQPSSAENSLTRRGNLLFAVLCANCHGPEGHGDGPAAAGLKMLPPDFAAGWKHSASDEAMRRVITQGIPGTAMPAAGPALWGSDLDAVVAFVRSLGNRHAANPLAAELRKAGFVADETPRGAPEIDLRNASNGAAVKLADFKGKAVLLCFWCTECLPCLKELPHLEELSRRFTESDFAVLAACTDDVQDAAATRVAHRYASDLAVFVDPKGLTRLRYGVQVMPTSVLIDREGRVLGRSTGAADWSGPALSDLVDRCLNPSIRR
ncbi:MAG TPA: redoxin domain-containing protein [Gemmataceae bacterium]|jgi:mono/diheme cytochrome c family protein/peroxiredoxin|nr:redoxin domain-containing protein [Gemmataceae bacterium]